MIGFGYDIHRMAEGESLVLAGVTIAHHSGTVAHSDGDVIYHALCDAIFGALGQGDIGEHFPDTDLRWKNASSDRFVEYAVALLTNQGYSLVNIDCTLVMDTPKIKPFKQQMRENIARLCAIPLERVNVKATTNEGVGFIGRGEGVAAMCVCQVQSLSPSKVL